MWYHVHAAEAHLSLSEYGPCIRMYTNIYKNFDKFWKNQMDYHRYAYRKVCIHAYMELVEWNNTLRDHPSFMRAAKHAMDVWFTIYKLQTNGDKEALERGSSPQNAMDKKKHRQNDPRGWNLIHDKYPLVQAKKWLTALLPTMDGMRQRDATNVNLVNIQMANLKYLLYTKEYQQFGDAINQMKEKDARCIGHPHFVYKLFLILDEFRNEQECKELSQLTKEYNASYLKQYFEQNINSFDKMRCILKCCLEINGLSEIINVSLKQIIETIIKLECLPMQCVQIRNDLSSSDCKDTLQIFERYVAKKFPLQLKKEDDTV